MARPRKPERDEAKKLYLQSGGKISAKELAAAVGVDDGRIRKWKSLDKWEDALQNQPKKKGGQPGNKNAAGETPAKQGNKNAVTHGAFASVSIEDLTEEQQEVERLTALLKQDRAFSENPNRELMRHPGAQKLAAAMILADSSVQEKIARNLSVTIDKMKAMLRSPDPLTSAQVLLEYQHLLADKAKAEGLTDTEKLLDSNLERADSMAQGTFHERMKWIQKEIEQAFQEKNWNLNFRKCRSRGFWSITGRIRAARNNICSLCMFQDLRSFLI